MIRAIFFDWFNTLAHHEPPREELQSQVLQEFGIHVSPQKLIHALAVADRGFFEENSVSPIRKRSIEEQAQIYTHYQKTLLDEVGVNVTKDPEMLVEIMKKVQQLSQGMRFTLFDDVLPTINHELPNHPWFGGYYTILIVIYQVKSK